MAKNLSERIADRMRSKKTTVSAQNRGAFLALKGEIIQAIEDRWAVKQIWETLHDEGKVTFSYQAFRNYVNSLILEPKQRAVSKPGAEEPRTEKQPSKVQTTVPETPRTPAPNVSPAQPPAATGFNFDAKPKKEDYI
jgi:hypothetical protein